MADGDVTPVRCCEKCGGSDFNRYNRCRACVRERTLAWRAANKDRLDEYGAKYRAENHEQITAQKREYARKNRDELNRRQREKRAANPEHFLMQGRAKRAREKLDPEKMRRLRAANYIKHREKSLARKRRWYEANKERAIAACAEYHKLHPEVARNARRRWKERNPESVRSSGRMRRGRIDGKLSDGLIGRLFKLQKGKCPCCGKPLGTRYHLDHITPLALGGRHADQNIQLLRDVCNLQKSKRHPVDFMQSRGFLL